MSVFFDTLLEAAKLQFDFVSDINRKYLSDILKSKYIFVLFLVTLSFHHAIAIEPFSKPKRIPIYIRSFFSIPLLYFFYPIFKSLLTISFLANKEFFTDILNYYTTYTYDAILDKLPTPVYKVENCLFYFFIILCILLVFIVFFNRMENNQLIMDRADIFNLFMAGIYLHLIPNGSIILITFIYSIEILAYIILLSFPNSGLQYQIIPTTLTFILLTIYFFLTIQFNVNIHQVLILYIRKILEFSAIITVFVFLIIHILINLFEGKPLINPKIFNSLTRGDDFYNVLVKFSEDVIFFYSKDKEKQKSYNRTINQDNLNNIYTTGININKNEKKNKTISNGYDNEYNHNMNDNYTSTIGSLSIISYPIEPTLLMINCNAIRNIVDLIVSFFINKTDKKEKENLMSETDKILYQQVRSNIPFSSDTEDSDYEEDIDMEREKKRIDYEKLNQRYLHHKNKFYNNNDDDNEEEEEEEEEDDDDSFYNDYYYEYIINNENREEEDDDSDDDSDNDKENENKIKNSNDIYKELFDLNYDHINQDSLNNSHILTRNQSKTLKYVKDIEMPLFQDNGVLKYLNKDFNMETNNHNHNHNNKEYYLSKDQDHEFNINSNNENNSIMKKSNSMLTHFFNKTIGYNHEIRPLNNSDNNKINEVMTNIKNQYIEANLCVACRKRPRTIVLWPCGCLCICETCRKVLALKKYDKCPCSDNKVEGYSKVYIP
ncbi:hypothetical protein BCR32DRAFT_290342 [Anaeromyces robustus]|uniref:RING-type domain-containing protein n=1 Tax=Anaeromyces robustus TaxID=1754192 RepID=A0A1Y1XJS9_9FUNG|nr:hypothetical protein BCR32DRAFT_290342 [Anaeromyces robustus]|eukprot:ORX86000.1 hypothetical protein BCR32DRAFT_290342 [Anaeromyces robustus]